MPHLHHACHNSLQSLRMHVLLPTCKDCAISSAAVLVMPVDAMGGPGASALTSHKPMPPLHHACHNSV